MADCGQHPGQPLDFWCNDCSLRVCSHCLILAGQTHSGHTADLFELRKRRLEYEESIRSKHKKLKNQIIGHLDRALESDLSQMASTASNFQIYEGRVVSTNESNFLVELPGFRQSGQEDNSSGPPSNVQWGAKGLAGRQVRVEAGGTAMRFWCRLDGSGPARQQPVLCSLVGVAAWPGEQLQQVWHRLVEVEGAVFNLSIPDSQSKPNTVSLSRGGVDLSSCLAFLGLADVSLSTAVPPLQDFSLQPGQALAELCPMAQHSWPDCLFLYIRGPNFDERMEHLKTISVAAGSWPPGLVEPGSAVLAPAQGGGFHRAEVLRLDSTKLNVMIVDKGYESTVSWWNCRILPPDLFFSGLATMVKVRGCNILSEENSKKLIETVQNARQILVEPFVATAEQKVKEVKIKVDLENLGLVEILTTIACNDVTSEDVLNEKELEITVGKENKQVDSFSGKGYLGPYRCLCEGCQFQCSATGKNTVRNLVQHWLKDHQLHDIEDMLYLDRPTNTVINVNVVLNFAGRCSVSTCRQILYSGRNKDLLKKLQLHWKQEHGDQRIEDVNTKTAARMIEMIDIVEPISQVEAKRLVTLANVTKDTTKEGNRLISVDELMNDDEIQISDVRTLTGRTRNQNQKPTSDGERKESAIINLEDSSSEDEDATGVGGRCLVQGCRSREVWNYSLHFNSRHKKGDLIPGRGLLRVASGDVLTARQLFKHAWSCCQCGWLKVSNQGDQYQKQAMQGHWSKKHGGGKVAFNILLLE